MTYVGITSALATRASLAGGTQSTFWCGDLPDMTPDQAYRFFQRVDAKDCVRLEALGYTLPSLSVDDLLTLGTTTYQVQPVGFTEVDPPSPCGYCRRCSLHDDPGGCLVVMDWEYEMVGAKIERGAA